MEEFELGAFAFGLILGAVVTACALKKSIRDGFKSLVVGVWYKITGKGGNKMALVALPYWLEWRLVVVLFVGGFLYAVWRGNGKSFSIIWDFIKGAYERLRDMFLYNIEDREAYNENAEQRKQDEEYKKELKKKKQGK